MGKIPPKQSGASWTQEDGMVIPANRLRPSEKLRESAAHKLATEALKIEEKLTAFKALVEQNCTEVINAIRKDHDLKPDSKGNLTWFNFDRSIKVEISIQDRIVFDETLIEGAKEILMDLINSSVTGDDFIKSIIMEAFQTTKGKLDTRRILGLKRHSSRIKSGPIKEQWDKAMTLIDEATTRPSSKRYYRIWVKDEDGEYQSIELNFSSI